MNFRTIKLFFVVFTCLLLSTCTSIISDYSLEAYKNATSLKARSLALIDLSASPYSKHEDKTSALMLDINTAYEFAAGIPKNKISALQWNLIRNV